MGNSSKDQSYGNSFCFNLGQYAESHHPSLNVLLVAYSVVNQAQLACALHWWGNWQSFGSLQGLAVHCMCCNTVWQVQASDKEAHGTLLEDQRPWGLKFVLRLFGREEPNQHRFH